MKLNTVLDLYSLISRGTADVPSRKMCMLLRKKGFESYINGSGFKKMAFDTRRIDQETEYNPRRGLQNYNRSESFISEGIANKIKNLNKLKTIVADLKSMYGKEPEWQDSNARVLLSTLDKGLRSEQLDGDYTEAQPAMGSLDYIEELLHMRYRLTPDDLQKMGAGDLKRVILSKDEELTRKDIDSAVEIKKADIGKESYDSLLEKLFGGVKATADNKSVERTVTITIKDTFIDEK